MSDAVPNGPAHQAESLADDEGSEGSIVRRAEESEAAMYEIKLSGHLQHDWSDWFANLNVTNLDGGQTILSGIVRDQAALHGMLARIRDLGLTLISVTREEQ